MAMERVLILDFGAAVPAGSQLELTGEAKDFEDRWGSTVRRDHVQSKTHELRDPS